MIQYTIPITIDEVMPHTSTGPAEENSLAPTPRTIPSFLYSMAGATMELAKPVIGTTTPAPANFAIEYGKVQPSQKLRRHDQDHHHTDRSSLIRKSPSNKTFLQP